MWGSTKLLDGCCESSRLSDNEDSFEEEDSLGDKELCVANLESIEDDQQEKAYQNSQPTPDAELSATLPPSALV